MWLPVDERAELDEAECRYTREILCRKSTLAPFRLLDISVLLRTKVPGSPLVCSHAISLWGQDLWRRLDERRECHAVGCACNRHPNQVELNLFSSDSTLDDF